jgi:MoaA/NifB/PqqE/SkfB family radical SAM enzyme
MLDCVLQLAPIDAGQTLCAEAPPSIANLLRSFDTAADMRQLQPPAAPSARAGALRMQAGYLFHEPGLLIAGGPAVADTRSGRISVCASEARDWLARRGRLRLDRREEPRAAGIGGRVREQLLGQSIRRILTGGADRAACTDRDFQAFARDPGDVRVPDRPPDAIVLHVDPCPETISLTLEPTTACNFKCGFCYGRHLPQGLLRADEVERLLDNLGHVAAVEITGEGEPLVNKDLFKIVDIFKRRGIWVHLSTNGSRLDDAMVGQILDSGIDRLATSLESVRPERYERLRPGGDFAAFRQGLERLSRARALRRHPLELYLWISLLRECLEEIDEMFAFAEQIGFDRVEMQALNPMPVYERVYDDAMRGNLLSVAEIRQLACRPDLRPAARSALLDLCDVYAGRACAIFDTAAMVYWQGRITPCRLLKLPDVPPMGSIVETSFADLWANPEFARFRFALRHGVVLRCCHGCPYVRSTEETQ